MIKESVQEDIIYDIEYGSDSIRDYGKKYINYGSESGIGSMVARSFSPTRSPTPSARSFARRTRRMERVGTST